WVGDLSRCLFGADRQIGAKSLHPGAFFLKPPLVPYKERCDVAIPWRTVDVRNGIASNAQHGMVGVHTVCGNNNVG
ncbi:MAG: hypothetical protein ACXWIH_05550, partial [Burkholderiales bacterium]